MVRSGGQETLEQTVLRFIQKHHLVSARQPLVVAVSGGPDSVCLLHILVNLQNALGVRLYVAHLNHQLRGSESEADARYVSDLAHQLGIPATTEERYVKSYQTHHRISLEEAAREVRYTFLAEVAQSIGADRVAVGHTVDDHIETILMHLIRGTGTRGLRGLQPSTAWRIKPEGNSATIIRPLLEVSRQETADYCRDHNLAPRLDASNLSLAPLRNRLRHQLLPMLKSYNPRIAEALLRTARIASDDLAYLEAECTRQWDNIAQEQENTIILDKQRLLELPPALRRYLLRLAIEKRLGSLKDIETRHIEEIMATLTQPAGRRINLPGGLIFSTEYDRYLLGQDVAASCPFPVPGAEFPLNLPGETRLPGWRIEASIISREQTKEEAAKGKGIGLIDNLFTAYLDFDKTGDNLLVRNRQPGDRFQPLGMSQPKKLNEFMIDAKIPNAWRQRIPIVCSPSRILWVVGWRIDDRVKVSDTTRRILCLKFERD